MSGKIGARVLLEGLALVAAAANVAEWMTVGADTETRYCVDVFPFGVDADDAGVRERGVDRWVGSG